MVHPTSSVARGWNMFIHVFDTTYSAFVLPVTLAFASDNVRGGLALSSTIAGVLCGGWGVGRHVLCCVVLRDHALSNGVVQSTDMFSQSIHKVSCTNTYTYTRTHSSLYTIQGVYTF